MNKKFLSAILFGALMVTSTGTFVSCKDYDDDITNLQEQVDAQKSDLATKVSALESSISSLQSAQSSLDSKIASTKDAAEKAAAEAQAAAIAAAKADLEAAKAELTVAIAALETEHAADVEALEAAIAEAAEAANVKMAEMSGAIQILQAFSVTTTETLEALAAADAALQTSIAGLDAKIAEQAVLVGKNTAAIEAQIAALEAYKASNDAAVAGNADAIVKVEKTLADMKAAADAQVKALNDYIAANNAAVEGNAASIKTNAAAIETLAADIKALQDGALTEAKVSEIAAQVAAELAAELDLMSAIYNEMVTSVSLYVSNEMSEVGTMLSFEKIVEQTNTFPADKAVADKQYTFTAGNSLTYTDDIIVRVSPTNAILKPENIALINSKGEELTDFVYVEKIEAYNPETPLYKSRTAANNGLWKVTFKLKDNYDAKAFEAATIVTDKNDDKLGDVRFAFAVNNTPTEEGAAARRVISSYDLTVEATNGAIAANDFLVNGLSIAEIHNRYTACEDGTSTENVQELSWIDDAKPGTKAILKDEGKIKKNAENRNGSDDRQGEDILPVAMGEPIKIQIDWNAEEKEANKPIKGFYVTLDKHFAMESVPSEINAWNSYEYENVGTDKVAATLIDGNEGTITIKNLNNVAGDIIGFRVYAVNLDGTLLDPDGRAFYVYVGDADSQSAIKGSVVATELAVETDYIAVPAGTFVAGDADAEGWVEDETNEKYAEDVNTLFNVSYFDKDKKETTDFSKVVYVKFSVDNVAAFVDNKTYTQTLKIYKSGMADGIGKVLLKTVTAKLTKTMPTAFPEDFAFRPMQEETEGTGLFRAYMIPSTGYEVFGTTDEEGNKEGYAEEGTKDLNNVFYGLDENYKFVFKTSALDKKNNPTSVEVTVTEGTEPVAYGLAIETSFINNTTKHEVEAAYLYKGVSTYYDAAEEEYLIGQDWEVAYNKSLSVIYACWHNASSFAWGTYEEKVDNKTVVKSYKPSLQWASEGAEVEAELAQIFSSNSYNNDYFGLDLKALIAENGWLKIKDESAKLTVNGQINPYFKPVIEGEVITFTQIGTQVDAAPTANHDENFEFVVIDAYGHEKTISLAVTIKAPAKK